MRRARYTLLPLAHLVSLTSAQTCENFGLQNSSSCSCPPGFGGSTCSQPACGGTIFQGSQRPLTPVSSGAANLTAASCACESGWTGTACNVCQSATACQSALSSAGQVSTDTQSVIGSQSGQNSTLVCNSAPRIWASGQMSCNVNNPTLQAIYPLKSTLNILRTIQPSLTPLPNITGFGSAGYVSAQLFYDGVEQFYCQAQNCTQTLGDTGEGSADWECTALQCKCRPGTTFCGGFPAGDLTNTINGLGGSLGIDCDPLGDSDTATCHFKQTVLDTLFGASGLALDGCSFGECVSQGVIDTGGTISTAPVVSNAPLSGGVIAGLAVVGALLLSATLFFIWGLRKQHAARKSGWGEVQRRKVSVKWSNLTYVVPGSSSSPFKVWFGNGNRSSTNGLNDDKVVLDAVTGEVFPGQMMAVLGPSGAGKTTLVELLAGRNKSGFTTGLVSLPSNDETTHALPRIGFVPQQDVLPPTLTVFEALLFAARLRLPESISDIQKRERVQDLMEKLGISSLQNTRIGYSGDVGGGKSRGISGGEMRRVSIGLELIASPDVLILDEPTSGLDSVSAARVANVLHAIAHDPENPIPIVASIHQPSSQLYQKFDSILLLSHGRSLYFGPGSSSPAEYFANIASGIVPPCPQAYNVADYLLEVASEPPVALFQLQNSHSVNTNQENHAGSHDSGSEKAIKSEMTFPLLDGRTRSGKVATGTAPGSASRTQCATTFLTQLQCLCGREWKILRRDKSQFITHVAVASVLGVICGGLYFNTGITIAGFQSRVGCLFFLGALIAFSSLSALYNVVEIRPLFLRERSSRYYSPTSWLLSRVLFDVIPLRIIPTIIVSTITYWMAGLAPEAAHFFKFLFVLVLYSLAMTLFNFLLGTFLNNGGIAILFSALSGLYQMTFAGFFVHLNSIPPVLRWLQWLCPLKYTLEALSVNEVDSGLMIQDTLQGVPVSISASVIMQLLFGFGLNNYYRDILILFGFIAGFGLSVIGVVWFKVRERR